MTKLRLTSIAMLVFVLIFGGIIIAQNINTTENKKQTCEQSSSYDCNLCSDPSECTPEKMEQCQKQCDQKMNCTPEQKQACQTNSTECATMKGSCTK